MYALRREIQNGKQEQSPIARTLFEGVLPTLADIDTILCFIICIVKTQITLA